MSDIVDILRKAGESLSKAQELIILGLTAGTVTIDGPVQWDGGDGLQNFDLEGAGTEELSQNMSELSESLVNDESLMHIDNWDELPPEVQENIKGIAEARGIPLQDAQDEYFRFIDLVNTYNIDLETAPLYGSEAQLRFGYVVGDALGIDPAYASLMNPNGGFTGPGANALNLDGIGPLEDSLPITEALAYHSPTHDGYGFLKHNFDVGPGYCYVPGGFCELGPDNPLSGQVSGISYWKDELDINITREEIIEASQEISREINEAGHEIYNEFNEGRSEILRELNEAGQEINGELNEFQTDFIDGIQDTGNELISELQDADIIGVKNELFEGAGEIIWTTGEGTTEVIFEAGEGFIETGREVLEGTAETIIETGEGFFETGREQIEGAGETVIGAVVDAANEMVNDIEDILDVDIPFVPGF